MKKYLLFFVLILFLDTLIVCSDFFEQYHIVLGDNWQHKIIGIIAFSFMLMCVILLYISDKKNTILGNLVIITFAPLLIAYTLLALVFFIRDSGYGMMNLILGPISIAAYFGLSFLIWFLLFRKYKK